MPRRTGRTIYEAAYKTPEQRGKIMTSKYVLTGISMLFVLTALTACGGGGGGGGGAAAPTSVALAETGQTLCYDAAGAVIACAGTGQDGDLKAGVAWPSPRFVVGTGATADCVTDNLTGLMWVKAQSVTLFLWVDALTDANNLTLCGHSDWRLPNRKELRSLINHSVGNSAAWLNTQGFSNVQPIGYWSSSSDAGGASRAWMVNMQDGSVQDVIKSVNSSPVWPVRAGQ